MPLDDMTVFVSGGEGGEGQETHRKGTLKSDKVLLNAVDSRIRDGGLAVFQDWGDIDGLPFDRDLTSVRSALLVFLFALILAARVDDLYLP